MNVVLVYLQVDNVVGVEMEGDESEDILLVYCIGQRVRMGGTAREDVERIVDGEMTRVVVVAEQFADGLFDEDGPDLHQSVLLHLIAEQRLSEGQAREVVIHHHSMLGTFPVQ